MRVIFFPSSDGQEYATVAGIPEDMSDDVALQKAQCAVEQFKQADVVWCDNQAGDPPAFSEYLVRHGLVAAQSILSGPQWD